jgi:hypothetical protein
LFTDRINLRRITACGYATRFVVFCIYEKKNPSVALNSQANYTD